MRLLIAHNSYQQPGGEDQVARAEAGLLESNGHEVVWFRRHNDTVREYSNAGLALRTLWNGSAYADLRSLIRDTRPDVCHFHNTFPLMSPAVFYAAKAEGTPVVATLHNYRLLCPGGTCLRDGKPCEECLSKPVPYPAIQHACYRSSRSASSVTAAMLSLHRMLGSWSRTVDLYIVPSEFARRKFIEGGLPAARIAVKPNFLAEEPDDFSPANTRPTALFVGRLAPEKGIGILLEAWRRLRNPWNLRIAGDGPMAEAVSNAAQADGRIEMLGALSRRQVAREMREAQLLIFPSTWYEVMPLTLIEAAAAGLPVLASNLGAIAEMIHDGQTGMLFAAGDAASLCQQLDLCWNQPQKLAEMRVHARQNYERRYTPAANYSLLLSLYGRVCKNDCTGEITAGREDRLANSYK